LSSIDRIYFLSHLISNIKRTAISPEVFLTLDVNVSFSLLPKFVQQGFDLNLTINVDSFMIKEMNVSYFAMDMPTLYKQEIKNTNWTSLAIQATDFISSILPTVNQKTIFSIPNFVSQFLKQSEITVGMGYLLIETDVGQSN